MTKAVGALLVAAAPAVLYTSALGIVGTAAGVALIAVDS